MSLRAAANTIYSAVPTFDSTKDWILPAAGTLVIIILIVLAVAYGYTKVMQPFHGDGGAKVRVVVPDGASRCSTKSWWGRTSRTFLSPMERAYRGRDDP